MGITSDAAGRNVVRRSRLSVPASTEERTRSEKTKDRRPAATDTPTNERPAAPASEDSPRPPGDGPSDVDTYTAPSGTGGPSGGPDGRTTWTAYSGGPPVAYGTGASPSLDGASTVQPAFEAATSPGEPAGGVRRGFVEDPEGFLQPLSGQGPTSPAPIVVSGGGGVVDQPEPFGPPPLPPEDYIETARGAQEDAREAQAELDSTLEDVGDVSFTGRGHVIQAATEQRDDARAEADRAAYDAVRAQQRANAEAQTNGEPPPYPAVESIDTTGTAEEVAFDIARLDDETQAAILGTTSAVPVEEVAQSDAEAIRDGAASTESADAFIHTEGTVSPTPATTLADGIESALTQPGVSDEYAQALAEELSPDVQAAGETVDLTTPEGAQVFATLSRAAEAGGPGAAEALGTAFAEGQHLNPPQAYNKKAQTRFAIERSVAEGNGASFAVHFADGLYNEDHRNLVAQGIADGIESLRSDFDAAQGEVDVLQDELNFALGGHGANLTEQQQQDLVEGHYERYANDYAARDEAGARLASTLNGIDAIYASDTLNTSDSDEVRALRQQAARTLREVPDLAQTPEGARVIGDALARSGQGEATFLDRLDHSVEQLPEGEQEALRLELAQTLFNVGGAQATALAGEGRAQALEDTTAGVFRQLQDLDMISAEGADRLQEALLAPVGETVDSAEAWAQQWNEAIENERALADQNPHARSFLDHLGDSLSGYGVAIGIARTASASYDLAGQGRDGNFTSDSVEDRAAAIVATADLSINAASTAVAAANQAGWFTGPSATFLAGSGDDAAGRLASAGALKVAGAITSGIAAGFDAANAVEAFRAGDETVAAGYAVSSLGGFVAAGASVAGWTGVGLVVTAASFVAVERINTAARNNRYEEPTRDALIDAGLSPELANQLANDAQGVSAGPALQQIASRFGMSGPEFYRWLDTQNPNDVRSIVEASHGVHVTEDGVYNIGFAVDGLAAEYHAENDDPSSVNGVAAWMVRQGLAPGQIVDWGLDTGGLFPNNGY